VLYRRAMPQIVVRPVAGREFEVEVRDGGRSTVHRVSVDDAMGLDGDLERLVRESFAFLLEREPATSILRRFALGDISRYFPEYGEEIRRRLG